MNPPILTIAIDGKRFEVQIENVCETAKDNRGGCVFKFLSNGKQGFIPFHRFSFVL